MGGVTDLQEVLAGQDPTLVHMLARLVLDLFRAKDWHKMGGSEAHEFEIGVAPEFRPDMGVEGLDLDGNWCDSCDHADVDVPEPSWGSQHVLPHLGADHAKFRPTLSLELGKCRRTLAPNFPRMPAVRCANGAGSGGPL